MRVTVIGASGFVGRRLVAELRARDDEVVTASLRDPVAAAHACDGAKAVVNLAGEPVAQRWTAAAKKGIRASRVDAPAALIERFATLTEPPRIYISASGIGYYGRSEDETFDEDSPPGNDFLADVCVEWEATAQRAGTFGMRVAIVRTALVLGTGGGALAKLLPIFKLGAGGPVASGRQWYSWVHLDDLVGIYKHALDGASGVLVASAPNPVRNATFTHALARAVRRPAIFPVPSFALRAVFGEGAIVLTEGQRVVPTRTIASGYRFRFETIDAALDALLRGETQTGAVRRKPPRRIMHMARIGVGDTAPEFCLKSEKGAAVSLAEALQAGPVVLIFYPMDNTPGCTAQLCRARDDAARYAEAGVTVYGVNNGGAASHRRFIEEHGLTAPLLIDDGLTVSIAYDAVISLGLLRFINRTVVGVANDGKILFYKRGTPSTDEILSAVTCVS